MIVRSPAACASCSATIDTPPVPSSTTVEPGARPPSANSAFHAVMPAHDSVDASS